MDQDPQEIIDTLKKAVERLGAENTKLRRQLDEAHRRIAELERAAARQAAPFRRREQKKIPPEERKRPGRKAGHFGHYRQTPDRLDYEVEQPLPDCPHCHGPLSDRTPLIQYIEEIPPLRPKIVRLVTWSGKCEQCGPTYSTHPLQTTRAQGVARTHLGPRALALAALLNKHFGMTVRSSCKVLRNLCGLSITPGGLSQAMQRVARKVEHEYEALIQQVRGSPAVYADETSWWVGGPGSWLWTFTTPQATVYRVADNRGSVVVRETLGDEFAGVLISDCLASYDPIECTKHKCIAHHLRAIQEAEQRPDTKNSRYLWEWRALFSTVLALYKARPDMDPAWFISERTGVQDWCDRLVKQPVTQAGELAVQRRMEKQWSHLLTCLYEPTAEPTNNRAERALRPAVIARKLSCGNKTDAGSRAFEVLASLAETCHQTGRDFVDFLVERFTLNPQPVLAG
jgi:transposase